MDEILLTWEENQYGTKLVTETIVEYYKLSQEVIKKDNIPEDELDDVLIGLLATKLLVAEGKLDEKYFKSAIS